MIDTPVRRRWFRYSLRTLLVLLTLLCAWLGTVVNRAQRQRLAVESLRDQRTLVVYDYQQKGGSGEPRGPRWLRHWIGDDYFQTVVSVMVFMHGDDERILENIDGLRDLRHLDVYGANVTDDDLRAIGRLRKLTHLTVGGDRITDRGLAHLAGLTELAQLGLGSNQITDQSVRAIASLKNLRVLCLSGSGLSDGGLEIVSRLPNLAELQVSRANVTNQGLKSLLQMKHLTRLTLEEDFAEHRPARITDEGLKYVAQLNNLRDLTLHGQALSNAGLRQLAGLSKLRDLDICHPQPVYTEEGVAELQSRIPALAVTHSAWAPMHGKYVGGLRLEAPPRAVR